MARVSRCLQSPASSPRPISGLVAFEDPGGNDEALNFAGAFVNFGDARIAVGALDGILAAVAVAAVISSASSMTRV